MESAFFLIFIGTTSACAENTSVDRALQLLARNYLRVRGEYSLDSSAIALRVELPPRARRILIDTALRNSDHGTTSACAENTGLNA